MEQELKDMKEAKVTKEGSLTSDEGSHPLLKPFPTWKGARESSSYLRKAH